MTTKIKTILNRWRSQSNIAENVVEWRVLAPKPADEHPFPEQLSPHLASLVRSQGIPSLYQHQALAYKKIMDGENIAVVSGTASGKTLAYNLPVIDSLLKQPEGKALYLFPTKALAQDQLSNLRKILSQLRNANTLRADIYDGDTPQHIRSTLRRESSIILTNPDMLHTGILPHHTG